jgi:hypothetical protein
MVRFTTSDVHRALFGPWPLGFASLMRLYAPTCFRFIDSLFIAGRFFKALIVLHTMIRNGATDNVLTYLSSSEVLRNVSTGNWEGH